MKIIQPSYEILRYDKDALKLLERIGRTCYKSEDKITNDSYEKFLKMIISRGHEAMIEHATITVKFIHNRGFCYELIRHRLASFAQQCLSGDTKILRFNQNRKHLTIKELYERQQDNQLRGRNKLMILRSIDSNNSIIPNKFVKVTKSGIKDVYKLTTKLGYSIKASKEHIFFNDNGEVKLKYLKIGDNVLVNGIKLIQDKDWLKNKRDEGLSLQTIANLAGVGYSTVRKYVRKFNLTTPLGYKPKNFKPWNKGLTAHDDIRVKKSVDALRKNQHKNGYRENNSSWIHDGRLTDSGFRTRFVKYKKEKCSFCGSKENLENHHKDGDITNWKESNKLTLCIACHQLIYKGYNVKKAILDEITDIKYIGKEETFDIEMEAPYHNFVANGFVVHNSTRYVNYKEGILLIEPYWCNTATKKVRTDWTNLMQSMENVYKNIIESGLPPQAARGVLPNDLETEIVITANFREWRNILNLRCAGGAHPDMRRVMVDLLGDFYKIYPVIFEDLSIKYIRLLQ